MDNPYSELTVEYYRIEYLMEKGIPTFYSSYGYGVSKWHDNLIDMPTYRYVWKYFSLTDIEKENLSQKCLSRGRNVMVFGYPKMDELASIKKIRRKRKKIIIASHHTIAENPDLMFSNFLKYSDVFLELPKRYPEIDFVFRPHPLLKSNLLEHNIWTQKQIDEYFERISNLENVEYQDGGEYFDTFVNSDAMIHDCGSFMAEYLFTGHPVCYMLKDEATNKKNYCDFAQKCIEQHYAAFNEEEIYHFIEQVVIKNKDSMKRVRKKFYKKYLRGKYPHVTKSIMKYFKKTFVKYERGFMRVVGKKENLDYNKTKEFFCLIWIRRLQNRKYYQQFRVNWAFMKK